MPAPSKRPSTATEHGPRPSMASATDNLAAWPENDDALANLVVLLTKAGYDFAPNLGRDHAEMCAVSVVLDWHHTSCLSAPALDADALAFHHKICSIMRRYEDEEFLDNFLTWARQAMDVREKVLQDEACIKTEHGTASDRAVCIKSEHGAASELAVHLSEKHITLSKDKVNECYRRIGLMMLKNNLLPHQCEDKRYIIKYDEQGREKLSGQQRSWIDMMLRKKLGSGKIATFIWKHGLPRLFDGNSSFSRRRNVTSEVLQSALNDGLHWWTVLLRDSLDYTNQPDLEVQRKLSSLDPADKQWRDERRTKWKAIAQEIHKAKALASERDNKKKSFADMTEEEQTCVEQWETGQTEKKRSKYAINKSGVGFHSFLQRGDET